jgi:hypothetical protein
MLSIANMSLVRLSVMLSVVILSVIMLNVVAPFNEQFQIKVFFFSVCRLSLALSTEGERRKRRKEENFEEIKVSFYSKNNLRWQRYKNYLFLVSNLKISLISQ